MQALPVQTVMDLKEQEDALSVQVWAQVIVFYVLMIRCRNNIKKA